MAVINTNPGDKASASASSSDAPKKFTIKTPNVGFKGERFGVPFMDGVGVTDDRIKAHQCLELGYDVLLTATGKPAWPKEGEKDSSENDGVQKK